MKKLTKKELDFLSTISNKEMKEGFKNAIQSTSKEEDLKFIIKQLPSLADIDSEYLSYFILRKDGKHFTEEGYTEIGTEVYFGSYLWYLCFNSRGFYWCGNPLYSEEEWDNETMIRVTPRDFDNPEKVAKKMLKMFYKEGCPRDTWVTL